MNAELFDRMGEHNPQLYRELKGKLNWRTLLVTVILSLGLQALLIFFNFSDRDGLLEINWENIFLSLNWLLPMFGSAIGVYQLSSDLCREQTRGTLNFVRFSPQPSENILSGKFLGVPILFYLGILLMLPLHLKANSTLIAGSPLTIAFLELFGVYPIWVGLSAIYYNIAALLALANPKGDLRLLPAASSLFALLSVPLALVAIAARVPLMWRFYPGINSSSWNWFFLPESFAFIWILATLFAINLMLWQILNRSFHNPERRLTTKVQSYWIVGCTNLWFLGFALPEASATTGATGTFYLMTIAPLTLLLMSGILSPPRQTLLDWARYRHQQPAKKRGLLRDLLLGEKSPSLGAIAVHFGIIAIIWLPWFVPFVNSSNFSSAIDPNAVISPLRLALSLLITASVCLIYATIVQSIRFHAQNPQQETRLTNFWFGSLLLPLVLAAICQLTPQEVPLLWLLSPLPLLGGTYASATTLFVVWLGQLALLAFGARRLQQQIARAGASESQELLEFFGDSRSRTIH